MWKVLIVDDDRNFRYALREEVKWESNGFELAAEAVHGKQALEIIEKQDIQIVLTDMEMPLMNGVQLTREVKARYPEIIVVALSAFDDYTFVRESLKLGASDYILKQDFDPDMVITLLKKLCASHPRTGRGEVLREHSREELHRYLREKTDKLGEDNLYGKILSGNRLSVCVAIGSENRVEERENEETPMADSTQLLCSIKEGDGRWIFVLRMRGTSSGAEQSAEWNLVAQRAWSYFSADAAIGLPDQIGTLSSLPKLLKDAETAVDYRLYEPGRRIYHYDDYRLEEAGREKDYRFQPETPIEDLHLCLRRFEAEALIKKPSYENVDRTLIHILRSYCAQIGAPLSEAMYMDLFTKMEAADELKTKMSLVLTEAETIRQNQSQQYQGSHPEIRAAIEYMENNYKKDLSLSEIAAYTGLSDNYFSNLFKKETGEGITSYLNRIRIRHAEELLRDSGIRVYEVAEAVGYKNASYFTTIFKKVTGQSVSEYRRKR